LTTVSCTSVPADAFPTAAATGAFAIGAAIAQPNGDPSIRPFQFHATNEALADLRRRVAAAKWPSRELVPDATQGVQLATMHALAQYWATDHDWRRVEARLNALPQFITEIDGVDIHFIHVRSKHDQALPVIVTHGWPGSIIEQLKIIDPLTNPTAHGGTAADAFDVVIPSLPGHGFSGKPTALGWDPIRIAKAWAVLMQRLGYTRYVAQGGDWGNAKPLHSPLPCNIPYIRHAMRIARAGTNRCGMSFEAASSRQIQRFSGTAPGGAPCGATSRHAMARIDKPGGGAVGPTEPLLGAIFPAASGAPALDVIFSRHCPVAL
jgi:hypothetical protein